MKCLKYFLPLILLTMGTASAQKQGYTKDNPRTLVKCYVKLADGEKTIYYAAMPKNDVSTLKHTLLGQQIEGEERNSKVMVDKVFECVLESEPFTKRKARRMDEENEL